MSDPVRSTGIRLRAPRILLLGRDPLVHGSVKNLLRTVRPEWRVSREDDAQAALTLVSRSQVEVFLASVAEPGWQELVAAAVRIQPSLVPILLVPRELQASPDPRAYRYLHVPCPPAALLDTIDAAVSESRALFVAALDDVEPTPLPG